MRFMVKDGYPKPIPGDSIYSTSADLHAYLGDFLGYHPTLMLDSEGFDGTKIPLAAVDRWNENIAQKREDYVKTAYPRSVPFKTPMKTSI